MGRDGVQLARRLLALLIALLPAACSHPETPRSAPCSGAAACLHVLCNPGSDALDLAYGASVMASGAPAALTGAWATCTRRALRTQAHRPAHCGMPGQSEIGFSGWDLFEMGYRETTLRRLVHGCAPRAAYLVAAAWGLPDSAATADVLREGARSRNRWVFRMARRGLMARGDATTLSVTTRELRSTDAKVQAKALDDLAAAGPAAQPAVPAIVAATARLPAKTRWSLVPFTLGRIGGAAAGRALASELVSPGFHTSVVLHACERVGPDAAAAAPELRALAESYPFSVIRELAARAYQSVTGKLLVPGPGRCPHLVLQSGASFRVYSGGPSIQLQALETDNHAVRRAEAGRCAQWLGGDPAYVGMQRGNTCLLGINHGEFGGWVEARDLQSGARQRIFRTNPLKFLDAGPGRVVVVSGLAHMFLEAGWLDRLEQRPDGHWESAPMALLDGLPIAYRRDQRALLILTRGREPGCKDNDYALVRVAADGRITTYPGPPPD